MSDFAAMRAAMVEGQVRTSDVQDRRILAALREIPRERFVPRGKAALAYADMHLEIAPDRVLIRPRELAKMLHALQVGSGELALDLACGRGYSTAILSRLAETVVAVEEDPDLLEAASRALAETGADNAAVIGGAVKAGARDQGPFHVILVNGAVIAPPQTWLDQLADGGRLGVFERMNGAGRAVIYRRDGGVIGRREIFDADAPFLPGFAPQPEFVF